MKSKGALRMGHSCSRHARNPLTQQLSAMYHRGQNGVETPWPCSVMIKRKKWFSRTDQQLSWPPEPTGFRNLAKVLSSREFCSFYYHFNTKTHLHPEGYPPPRCDHPSSSLRSRLFVNSTFKREARQFYTNHDKRSV